MKCACPKCSALLSEDLPEIPGKGKSGKCSKCGVSYWIHRESFMLRAYTVTGERYCIQCGGGLGLSTYCPGCVKLYPDYCVVHSKKPAQRAFEKNFFSFNLSCPSFAAPSSGGAKRFIVAGSKRENRSSNLRRQLTTVGVGLGILAVVAVLSLLYLRDRAENKFAKEFIVALYGVKSGTDQCLKKSALLASGNRLSDSDMTQLKSVKTEIDKTLQALSPAPVVFNDAHLRLKTLSGTYEKLYTLCISSGPTPEVATVAGGLEAQFMVQAEELKGTLPPKLNEELADKAPRYTNLQFLLK